MYNKVPKWCWSTTQTQIILYIYIYIYIYVYILYKVIAQNEIHRNRTDERATSFALPSFWLYKTLPEHLVPIALRTAYTVCQTYIRVLATGLSWKSLNPVNKVHLIHTFVSGTCFKFCNIFITCFIIDYNTFHVL